MRNNFILFGVYLALNSSCIAQQSAMKPEVNFVASPDSRLEIVWNDYETGVSTPKWVRIITMVDIANLRSVFSEVTIPRYTGAVWNSASNRCAVYNAPDNANTYFWIVLEKQNAEWIRHSVNLFKLIEQQIPSGNIDENPRGGIESLKWHDESIALVTIIYQNQKYQIEIDANKNPISSKVKKIK